MSQTAALPTPNWPKWQQTCWQADEPAHILNADRMNARGILYARKGQLAEAQNSFEEAVSVSSQYHHYVHYTCSAIYTLAAELTAQFNDQRSVQGLLKAALFQDHTNARALAMQQGNFKNPPAYERDLATDEAWRHAIRLPHIAPPSSDTSSLHDEAYACIRRGEYKMALAALRVARNITPDMSATGKMPRLLLHHAQARADQFQLKEALAAIKHAIESAQKWHDLYHRQSSLHRLHLGRVLALQDEWELACEHFRQAIDLNPKHPEGYEARAIAYHALEQDEQAQKDLQKAASLRQKLEFSKAAG